MVEAKQRPLRFNEVKQRWEILVGGKRWRIADQVTCDNCGKRVYKEAVEIPSHSANFCSRSCATSRRNHKYWIQQGRGTVAKWCRICGTRFLVKSSHYNRYTTCGKDECKRTNMSLNSLEYQRKKREALHERN